MGHVICIWIGHFEGEVRLPTSRWRPETETEATPIGRYNLDLLLLALALALALEVGVAVLEEALEAGGLAAGDDGLAAGLDDLSGWAEAGESESESEAEDERSV